MRQELRGGEFARGVLDGALLGGKLEIHRSRMI